MDRLREGEESVPGMGMLTLAAVAREKGYEVHLVDAKAQGAPLEDVVGRITDLKPDYLGISATTVSVTNGARIAKAVKGELPKVTTILGGAHVSAIPERTLEAFPIMDFGIAGEGEISLFALLDMLESGEDYNGVPGLAYRRDGKIYANSRAPYLDDLDALPMPAWDLLPDFPHGFQPSIFSYPRTPVASIMTSRGCPFSCTFCDRSTSGRRGRMHSVPYVVDLCRHLFPAGSSAHHLCRRSIYHPKEASGRVVPSLHRRGLFLQLELQQSSQSTRFQHDEVDEGSGLLADRLRNRIGLANGS